VTSCFVSRTQAQILKKIEISSDTKKPPDGGFEKMAQEEGLEPPTKRLTAACSTD
jgi:hypothetical protein